MGATTSLRRELKLRFFPQVEQHGFRLVEREAPMFWIFRRATGASVQLFSLQWDKYGRPRFRVDFGSCPIGGLDLLGKHVGWADMHPHWLPDVATLKPAGGVLAGSWYRQDRALLRRLLGGGTLRAPADVVDELVAAYPEMEAYWANGSSGRRIRRWANS